MRTEGSISVTVKEKTASLILSALLDYMEQPEITKVIKNEYNNCIEEFCEATIEAMVRRDESETNDNVYGNSNITRDIKVKIEYAATKMSERED
jgi:hypothetical protein